MGAYKHKIRRGSGAYYAWDGDMLHLPIELVTNSGVGTILDSTVGTSLYVADETAFDNLVISIKAAQVDNLVTPLETATGNAGAVADIQGLLDQLTFTTT